MWPCGLFCSFSSPDWESENDPTSLYINCAFQTLPRGVSSCTDYRFLRQDNCWGSIKLGSFLKLSQQFSAWPCLRPSWELSFDNYWYGVSNCRITDFCYRYQTKIRLSFVRQITEKNLNNNHNMLAYAAQKVSWAWPFPIEKPFSSSENEKKS